MVVRAKELSKYLSRDELYDIAKNILKLKRCSYLEKQELVQTILGEMPSWKGSDEYRKILSKLEQNKNLLDKK